MRLPLTLTSLSAVKVPLPPGAGVLFVRDDDETAGTRLRVHPPLSAGALAGEHDAALGQPEVVEVRERRGPSWDQRWTSRR